MKVMALFFFIAALVAITAEPGAIRYINIFLCGVWFAWIVDEMGQKAASKINSKTRKGETP